MVSGMGSSGYIGILSTKIRDTCLSDDKNESTDILREIAPNMLAIMEEEDADDEFNLD